MSSRDAILRALRQNRPPPEPLPEVPTFAAPPGDLADAFARVVEAVGGRVVATAAGEAGAAVEAAYPACTRVASKAPEVAAGNVDLTAVADPHALADLDLLVCRAVLGVAENGALWVPESRLGHRAAPFLAGHVAVVLDRRDLVWSLHDAYARLRCDAEGFGVFISGPSKTADIEQALVIGAHGPRSLTVVLEGDG